MTAKRIDAEIAKRMLDTMDYSQWLHDVVEDSRAGLADGTNKRIESDEWERIRSDKIRQRADMAKIISSEK
jgi:hypothetical protein